MYGNPGIRAWSAKTPTAGSRHTPPCKSATARRCTAPRPLLCRGATHCRRFQVGPKGLCRRHRPGAGTDPPRMGQAARQLEEETWRLDLFGHQHVCHGLMSGLPDTHETSPMHKWDGLGPPGRPRLPPFALPSPGPKQSTRPTGSPGRDSLSPRQKSVSKVGLTSANLKHTKRARRPIRLHIIVAPDLQPPKAATRRHFV